MLLYRAVLAELQEYAFSFYNLENINDYRKRKEIKKMLENIPSGRLRQMLQDADTLKDLWTMVESMKTSDVSSESAGKKANSITLLKEFYGEKADQEVDYNKLVKDKTLLKEIENNDIVYNKLKLHWKEPLFTLLHMVHYQKKGAKR